MEIKSLFCETCGGRHSAEIHANWEAPESRAVEPEKPKEVEKQESAVEEIHPELQDIAIQLEQTGNHLSEKASGPLRKRKAHEFTIPAGRIPTKEKEEDMVRQGLKIKTVAFFNPGTTEETLIEVDDRIGDIYKKGERLIRKKFEKPWDKEIHRQRLSAVVIKLIAKYHPEYLGGLERSTIKIRFVVLRKGGEVKFALSPVLPAREEIIEPFEDLENFVDFAAIRWETLARPEGSSELLAETPSEKAKNALENASTHLGQIPSDLRKLALELGGAHKTGEWSEGLVENFIKLMDHLPQYAHYRLAFLDLLLRVKNGEFSMPKKILSVVSGPQVEERAQKDLEAISKEFDILPPKIFNVDLSQSMLVHGREAFVERYGEKPKGTDVRALAQVLPFRDEAFDLSECASLDVISNPKDVYSTLSEMARVTKSGGILRIIYRHRLPVNFYKALEQDLGLELITRPHTAFALPEKLFNDLKDKYGKKFAERLKNKIGREEYILLRRTGKQLRKTIDLDKYNLRKNGEEEILEPAEIATPPPEMRHKLTPVEILVEPEPDHELLEQISKIQGLVKSAEERWRKTRQTPAFFLKQRVMREIADSLRDEALEGIVVIKQGEPFIVAGKRDELQRLKEAAKYRPLYDGVRLLPRRERINLLQTYAPRLTEELEEDGVI